MYKIGEHIFHIREGMFTIIDIVDNDFNGESKKFYVMKPMYASISSSYQLPVELDSSLRYPMDKKTAKKLLKELRKLDNLWIQDNKKRKELFQTLFATGDIKDLANIVYTISLKKQEYALIKKSLPLSDFKTLQLAKKLIFEEFCYALDIPYSEIEDFLIENLK